MKLTKKESGDSQEMMRLDRAQFPVTAKWLMIHVECVLVPIVAWCKVKRMSQWRCSFGANKNRHIA